MRQISLQAGVVILVLSLAWPYYGIHAVAMPWRETAFAIGGLALAVALATRQPWWWCAMHAAFMPLAWYVAQLAIAPGWFLLAFIVMLLIYRGAISGQVPLYLSNAPAVDAVAGLLAQRPEVRLLDVGAGVGSLLLPLARRFPGSRCVGVENAPLTWLIGKLRTRRQSNIEWRWGDLWRFSLADFDIVYAFLSPAPMEALWQKACQEMRPGSLFVSNSFAVPDIEADAEIELPGLPGHVLWIYRLPE